MASLQFNSSSIFTIHQDLDGDKSTAEFVDREQFIGLVIGSEEFLLPILNVREIIMFPPITFLPNAPKFIEGVINLRGIILPAINLRKMMGVPKPEKIAASRIIIAKHENIAFGLIVDAITYVMPLLPQDIQNQNLPKKGPGSEFIGSICKQGPKVKGILDLSRIMNLLSKSSRSEHTEKTSA